MKTFIRRELEAKGLQAYHCNGCHSIFEDLRNQEIVRCPVCERLQVGELI